MWQIDNRTPFAAGADWVRDRDGAEVWLVAVRCAFRVYPDGTTAVDKVQDPPVLAPVYYGDSARSSLLYDSDFYLTKPTTDILLHGYAHAPEGEPTTQVDVSMRVGAVSKSLRVIGDRVYEKGLAGVKMGSPQPFTRMLINYERTYGGREPAPPANADRPQFEIRNPIGRGFKRIPGQVAPNVVYPGWGADEKPAGFGPIPPQWAPRLRYAGTYDEAWRTDRLPLYPEDLNDRFFLCSPDDQQPEHFLCGGEPVELINLTLSHHQKFVLPRLAFRFETMFRGKPSVTHRGTLHSVILEPEMFRVVLVWQTVLRAHTDVLRLIQTKVTQLRLINPKSRPSQ